MTAPVKERRTRRNLPLHFRSAFPFPLRFRSSFLSTLRFRSARLPKFSVGKNLARGRAGGFWQPRGNFLTPGRGLQGSPARRSRDAPERPSLPPRRRTAAL